MNERIDPDARERAVLRYVDALDRGDLEMVAVVLRLAEGDPELDRMLAEVDAELHAEAGLRPFREQAQVVRRLLFQHLPSATQPAETPQGPPTVGDVAQRLEAELGSTAGISAADRLVNRGLLDSPLPVAPPVTTASVARLAATLGAHASGRYWERFRRAAVALAMARQQSAVQVAAARRQRSAGRGRPAADPRGDGRGAE